MPKRHSKEYKRKVIQACQEGIPIYDLSQSNGIAVSTIYRWIKESEAEILIPNYSALFHKKERLERIAEKIRIILSENGIHVGKKRIRDIMRELGLESIRENAKRDYKKRQEYRRKNLLNQNFTASRQNEVWVSDITYFKVKDYGFYLCVIIDLFSRKVVGYRVSRKCSTQLVLATFRKVFQDRGNPSSLTFLSDRGSRMFPEYSRHC